MTGPVGVTPALLAKWALPEPGSDKDARGVVLLVAGSRRTPGAALLSGEACLRVGGGKLQVATAASVATQVALALPEAYVQGLAEDGSGDITAADAGLVVEMSEGAGVVVLGPGLTSPAAADRLLAEVVPHLQVTTVVDALASAHLTEQPDALHHLDGDCVLTVNPTELSKTLGVDQEVVEDDPVTAALRLAERVRAVVLCGGTVKTVATPDQKVWQVHEGCPGLGVAGSGDVQAGFVGGLLAQGASAAQAAVWGAYLHAVAGDRLADRGGPIGFLARELPAQAPSLLADLTG